MKNKHVNAIVVGAGAGGGIIAKELAVNGLSVVLFERGKWPVYDEHPNDELISQRTEVLGSPFGPDPKKNPRVLLHGNNKQIVTPITGGYSNNAACVGSGTVSYGAMAWRFMEEDFKLKSTYGHVEGSTLEDWPITYNDLEPYYEKAEWEIGVSGDDTQNPFSPPRKKRQPMPPFEYNREGQVLHDASKRLGLHPFPIPMLRNSVPNNGRTGCIRNRTCCGFACPVDAKNGTQNTVIPVALATGNCEIRTNSKVVEIMINDSGQATGVKYFDDNDKPQVQTADLVVVSGAAVETARLLLNSKSELFPNGAGNNYDWVGRNLMGHAYTGAFGLFDYDILDFSGPGATVALCDYNHNNSGIIGGGVLANEFNRLPYLFTNIRPPGSARWGKKHKAFQREMFHRTAQVVGPIQEMPVFESRVTVDQQVKDYWGVPVAAMSGERHPLDYKHCKFLSSKAEEILIEAGASQTWQSVGGRGGPSGGQHQNGTARMGNDKKTSVVNRYGQIHEIDNLFVADGSIMVSGGGFNPALTIMALGFWVGNYIVKNFAGTKFKG
ncbi:GMC oxidoreductase [Draconibacterium mangrovi]|uniref:GMC oxidoreductase n=1 Tax=Draconibacterium mangrovi TaxID=2697469 RepID=UPI0013D52FDE|nr:GMC family oxidoreductase [Draconibacterium mangrovi]